MSLKPPFQPSVEILADSINESSDRITTFLLTYQRSIHPQLMSYRAFSRNSSSNRAIPTKKLIEIVRDANIEPLYFGANCKGMAAQEEVSEQIKYESRMRIAYAREYTIAFVEELLATGLHKETINYYLDPFAPITVVCTSTDYQNFFNQRCYPCPSSNPKNQHQNEIIGKRKTPQAKREMSVLANAMKTAYDASIPRLVESDSVVPWHIPFLKAEDWDLWLEKQISLEDLIKVAIGRNARASYLNHNGDRDLSEDIKLHDRLLAADPMHLSPFEHPAIATPNKRYANFHGWQSRRWQIEKIIGLHPSIVINEAEDAMMIEDMDQLS